MTGSYVTQVRQFPLPTLTYKLGDIGSPGGTGTIDIVSSLPSQKTVSFRTGRNGVAGTSDELTEDDLRVTRNGFKTFDPKWDKGHEFSTTRTSVELHCPNMYVVGDLNGSARMFYRGPLVPKTQVENGPAVNSYPTIPPLSSSEIASYGQRAINQTAPTAPQASAAQAVAELRQALPQVPGHALLKEVSRRKDPITGSADEFLNWEFGVAPLLSDIRKIASSLQRQSKILAQLQRDNGRVVRRRFAFPTTITNAEASFYGLYGPYNGVDSHIMKSYGNDPKVDKITRTERSIWFSGAFSYWIPTDSSVMSKLESFSARANVLLGARLSPDVLWELAPWSWLIDWQANIGTALKTATRLSEDSLVIRYGYLMSHTVKEETYMVGQRTSVGGTTIPASSLTLRSERKERVRSTPYGFGVDLRTLKDSQWAILLALGITKGKGVAV
jgi:hypothetical protein